MCMCVCVCVCVCVWVGGWVGGCVLAIADITMHCFPSISEVSMWKILAKYNFTHKGLFTQSSDAIFSIECSISKIDSFFCQQNFQSTHGLWMFMWRCVNDYTWYMYVLCVYQVRGRAQLLLKQYTICKSIELYWSISNSCCQHLQHTGKSYTVHFNLQNLIVLRLICFGQLSNQKKTCVLHFQLQKINYTRNVHLSNRS